MAVASRLLASMLPTPVGVTVIDERSSDDGTAVAGACSERSSRAAAREKRDLAYRVYAVTTTRTAIGITTSHTSSAIMRTPFTGGSASPSALARPLLPFDDDVRSSRHTRPRRGRNGPGDPKPKDAHWPRWRSAYGTVRSKIFTSSHKDQFAPYR